jgi:uncharacterized membrane protein
MLAIVLLIMHVFYLCYVYLYNYVWFYVSPTIQISSTLVFCRFYVRQWRKNEWLCKFWKRNDLLKKKGVVEKGGRRKRNPCPMRSWFQCKVLGTRGFPSFYEGWKWRHNVEKWAWHKIDEIRVVGHTTIEYSTWF